MYTAKRIELLAKLENRELDEKEKSRIHYQLMKLDNRPEYGLYFLLVVSVITMGILGYLFLTH